MQTGYTNPCMTTRYRITTSKCQDRRDPGRLARLKRDLPRSQGGGGGGVCGVWVWVCRCGRGCGRVVRVGVLVFFLLFLFLVFCF